MGTQPPVIQNATININVRNGQAEREFRRLTRVARDVERALRRLSPLIATLSRVMLMLQRSSILVAAALLAVNRQTPDAQRRFRALVAELNALSRGFTRVAATSTAASAGIRGTGRSARGTDRSIRRLASAIATLRKALISMIGVLIAFNLLITLPQQLFFGLVAAIRGALGAISDFEQRVISLQTVIAGTLRLDPTGPIENFEAAGRAAEAVIAELEDRVAESVLGLDDLIFGFQVLARTGSLRFVRNLQEAVDLTIGLTNAVATLTQGQDTQRQLSQEITDLMTRQLRANSALARFIFRSRDEMEKFLDAAQSSEMFVDLMLQRIQPFVLAARRLGESFEGIKTTLLTIAQIFGRRAFGGIFAEGRQELLRIISDLRALPDEFNRTAAVVGSSLRVLGREVVRSIEIIFDINLSNTEALIVRIQRLIPRIIGFLATIIAHLTNIVQIAKFIFSIIGEIIIAVGILNLITGARNQDLIQITKGLLELFIGLRLAGESIISVFDRSETFFQRAGGILGELVSSLIPGFEGSELLGSILGQTAGLSFFHRFRQNLVDVAELIQQGNEFLNEELNLLDASAAGRAAEAAALAGIVREHQRINSELADRSILEQELGNRGLRSLRELNEQTEAFLDRTRRLRSEANFLLDILSFTSQGFGSFQNQLIVTGRRLEEQIQAGIAATDQLIEKLETQISVSVGLVGLGSLITATAQLEQAQAASKRLQESLTLTQTGLRSGGLVGSIRQIRQEIEESVLEGAQLIQQIQDATRVQADIGFAGFLDPEELQKALENLDEVRTRISGLNATLLTLQRTLLQVFDTTLGQLGDELLNRLKIQILEDALERLGEAANHVFIRIRLGSRELEITGSDILRFFIAIGDALANTVRQAVAGTKTVAQAFRDFIASIIEFWAQLAVYEGSIAVARGLLLGDFKQVALGLKLIALGLAGFVLAATIRGSGGGASAGAPSAGGGAGAAEPTFAFNQAFIDVNQTQAEAAINLNEAAKSLQAATDKLEAASAKDVFIKGSRGHLVQQFERESRAPGNVRASFNVARNLRGGSR